MKKIAFIGLVMLCSAGAYAQGVVTFQPYQSGVVDGEVYSPNPSSPTVEEQGPTTAQISAASYTTAKSYPSTLSAVTYGGVAIGGASYTGTTPVSFNAAGSQVYTYGNLFTAELYAVSTTTSKAIPTGTTLASLSPVTQYQSTFATSSSGNGAGYFNEANPATPDPGILGTGYVGNGTAFQQNNTAYLGNSAAAAVVAWFNGGGQFTTYEAAKAAGVPTGYSSVFEITGLIEPSSVMSQETGTAGTAGQTGSTYLTGLDYNAMANTAFMSFSLTTSVPEPGTIALGVLGACAFLARRRKK
jgi:hypothetical protein